MKEQADNLQENVQKNNAVENKKPSLWSKIFKFIKKHPLVYVLLFIIIVMFIWFTAKISSERKAYQKSKTELTTRYEFKLDSLQVKNIEFSSMVFSWSVRSEMLRNNMDNLNQLFNIYIKESGANLIQLVNADDNIILLSSDKKFEGTKFQFPAGINTDTPITITDSVKVSTYTPVMGFNKKLGSLIVEMKNK